jgi:hypothetical protein
MAVPFEKLSFAEFAARLATFPFRRRISAVHMHHTWRPSHADFRRARNKEDVIAAMQRFHTAPPPRGRGFRHIAQHITIDPEGAIWLGRDWNLPPASEKGQNGNSTAGPFMFEMIGNFDIGKDAFRDPQRACALLVTVALQKRFGLPAGSLRFHNHMARKTCPGSALDYQQIVGELKQLGKQLDEENPQWWRALVPGTSPRLAMRKSVARA